LFSGKNRRDIHTYRKSGKNRRKEAMLYKKADLAEINRRMRYTTIR